ncbi:putative peptide maturation dehydrogenase [Aquimonas sp.]|jgi:putative peptide maturation dehydrogenase|uniref:putative peptide maturation dehydrogenase n=1 Tax=Aquimonas sp. TaxID=1872588 RepID=UPI0037BF3632
MSASFEFHQVRRRQPCIIEIADELLPDLAALFSGRVQIDAAVAIFLLCPLSGARIRLEPEELSIIATLTADAWQPVTALLDGTDACAERIGAMVERGVLVSDGEAAAPRALREGEKSLRQLGWHALASVYHAQTRWSGIVGDEGTRDHSEEAHLGRLQSTVSRNGLPPEHLPCHAEASERFALPSVEQDGELWRVLRARATTRAFDINATLPARDLAEVLSATFSPLGQRVLGPGLVALRRASPSGGGLHPIEAYVLVVRVEGIDSGLYHYEAAAHRLARLQAFDEAHAREQVERQTIGQSYFAEAHALVFHVARAHRNFWKYRRHPKAYKVLFTDAGHLSQTFYLAAAALGRGAFYTGAINDADICEWIGLDPMAHVVVGANGIGVIDPCRDELHLRPSPMLEALPGVLPNS